MSGVCLTNTPIGGTAVPSGAFVPGSPDHCPVSADLSISWGKRALLWAALVVVVTAAGLWAVGGRATAAPRAPCPTFLGQPVCRGDQAVPVPAGGDPGWPWRGPHRWWECGHWIWIWDWGDDWPWQHHKPRPCPTPTPAPTPTAAPTPTPAPRPTPTPTPRPSPTPAPAPPVVRHTPPPEPRPGPGPRPRPAPSPVSTPSPSPSPAPVPAPRPRPAPSPVRWPARQPAPVARPRSRHQPLTITMLLTTVPALVAVAVLRPGGGTGRRSR